LNLSHKTLSLNLNERSMEKPIKIQVAKQLDGYVFGISLNTRNLIKKNIPDACPANRIFVSYDNQSDFKTFYPKLETYILSALLGVENIQTIIRTNTIEFIDNETQEPLHILTNE
jgi:hypothetical protein